MTESLLNGKVQLHAGDCLAILPTLAEASFDACVTDPPYHLASIVKRFSKTAMDDETKTSERIRNRADGYARSASGFMGKKWDGGDIAFDPATWCEVLRVLKPGAHLVAFGAPKNAHRLTCAIEDAGFEIRDVVMWLFGQGFPKSHNIGNGWGTALKPAYEPIILARKPLAGTVAETVQAHGTGGINVDACRVSVSDIDMRDVGRQIARSVRTKDDDYGMNRDAAESGVAVVKPDGRWPANVAHDGSAEVVRAFPQSAGGGPINNRSSPKTAGIYGAMSGVGERWAGYADDGSAARFFYCAKATRAERAGSKHPTVKPLDLMRWLVRMVTPKDGLILDPFAGTGMTGEAAWREGMRAALIEMEAESQADIRRRMQLVMAGPEERARAIVKATKSISDPGPLFSRSSR
jgi:site-specific DNA-methyltransferase (adenine-specific)